MRILLANPPCRTSLGGGKERFFIRAGSRWPWSLVKRVDELPRYAPFPFYLAYSAALLERDDFDVQALDGIPLNLTEPEFHRRVSAIQPDLILFETSTPTIHRDVETSARLREATGARIALAGPHVTEFPTETLSEHEHVDFVLVGEYEMTFLELARRLRDDNSLDDLDGIAYRAADGKPAGGRRGREINPVDELPHPARHLFPSNECNDLSLYHDGFCQHRPAVQLHASRGCPFRCDFCLWIQVMYGGGRYRVFSPKRVVDEMVEAVERYGAREIYFDDDTFTVNSKHVFALCDEIRSRGLKVPWSVMGDAMASTEKMLETMAAAGCIGMKFGLESADPRILKEIQKPVKLPKLERVVKTATSLGIKTHMTVSFGLSGDTRESIERTFEYACRLDVDSVQFSITTPFPGTRFYEKVKKEGRLLTENWAEFDGASTSVVRYTEVDPRFMEEFELTAGGRWLRRKLRQPRWVLRQMRTMGRVFRGQGWKGFKGRLKRGFGLLWPESLHAMALGKD